MKYCPTSTVFRNPASVKIFIIRSCCESLSTRSLYFCNKFSCAWISIEGVGVVVNNFASSNNGSDCPANTRLPVLFLTCTVFLTQIWDSSVDTEIINRNNCAKEFQPYHHRHRSESIIFLLLCFRNNGLVARKTGCPLSPNLIIINSATLPHSPRGLSM